MLDSVLLYKIKSLPRVTKQRLSKQILRLFFKPQSSWNEDFLCYIRQTE